MANIFIPVLSAGLSANDGAVLRKSLAGAAKIRSVSSCQEALESLRGIPWAVIVCECLLSDGSWQHILREAQAMTAAPPVIVVSRLADDDLWARVLNLGGYDVLATPLDGAELKKIVITASKWYSASKRRCA